MPRTFESLLTGFTSGALEGYTKRKEAERQAALEFEQKRKLLEAEAQLKAQYDPEAIVKNRLLNLARVAGQVPTPEGGYNVTERQAGAPEAVAGSAQEREMNVLRHLLPRQPLSLEDIYAQSKERAAGAAAGTKEGRPIRLRSGQQESVLGAQKSIQSIQDIKTTLANNPDIITGLTPAGTSRWEFVRGSKLGNWMRQSKSAAHSTFFTTYNQMQDDYRRWVTGAQAGFPEIALFLPTALPNPSIDRPDQFKANLDQFEVKLRQGMDRMKNILESEGLTPEQIETVFRGVPGGIGAEESGKQTAGHKVGRFTIEAE